MLVSIIIPLKNGMPYFAEVVKAVQRQRANFDIEVIVIDSGSSDGSQSLVPVEDKRFRLVEILPSEFGHGKTRNLGVTHARGEFCAFLTHDALPANDIWLAELVQPLLADDKVAGVFGRHIAYENASPYTKDELERHFESLSKLPVAELLDAVRYVRDAGYRQLLHFYSDNSSCMRKSVWERYPYPDVNFAEDQLWAKTIIEAGFKKAYAHSSVVYHSHDYPAMERLRRSYDEAKAFEKYFGYIAVKSLSDALKQVYHLSKRDLKYAYANDLYRTHPLICLKQPVDNFMRQAGYLIGSRYNRAVSGVEGIISRDHRLFRS